MERLEQCRDFYAKLVTSNRGDGRVRAAFASTPREKFVGEGPWRVFTAGGHIETPSSDPAFLYQDVLVVLEAESGINNGQPSLHAMCLEALNVQPGERVVHIGAGTGYYTALLAHLTGASGSVDAYEIEPKLAARATANLADLPNVRVHARSGAVAPLPECDVMYVNAGATRPLDVWLDALRPGGRLLFPLTATQGSGAMLLVTRAAQDEFAARFLCQATFIPCVGARDEASEQRLAAAFQRGRLREVQSLELTKPPDEAICWYAGENWWLAERMKE